jgi:hypothetical protein
MGDPELRSDEKVLVRTQGVYVKSIPFEGILTNKRIILIDRAKNLLPPKEIPLVTIKEVDSGENAIRDQILTLSIMAKTGETRQMILTFSRQAGGNRIRERDEWQRIIRENTSSSFDQVIRKVIPGLEQVPRRAAPAEPVRPETAPPVQHTGADLGRSLVHDEGEMHPVRKNAGPGAPGPVPPAPAVQAATAAPAAGVFCSSCGKKVPAGSAFCNRCGSQIIAPVPVPPVVEPQAPVYTPPQPAARSINQAIQSIDPLIEPSTEKIPGDPLRTSFPSVPLQQTSSFDEEREQEPVPAPTQQPSFVAAPSEQPPSKGFMPRTFSPEGGKAAQPASGSWNDQPAPPKPPRGPGMSGKKAIMTIGIVVVVIVLLAAGALFLYPMLAGGGTGHPGGSGSDVTTAATPRPPVTMFVPSETTHVIPASGVFVHVNYLGGWKGTYGMPSDILSITNSGDRVMEVENANGTVNASFEKLDGSAHELLVEIYKDNTVLTSGRTTIGHGSVVLSVNLTTGVAETPVTSGGGTTTSPTPTSTTNATANTSAAAIPVVYVTTTGIPVSNTTTNTTTTLTAAETTTTAP